MMKSAATAPLLKQLVRRCLFYSVFAIVSPDFSCGGTKGYTCTPGLCCSQHGWCGTSVDYCAAGCQPLFGVCQGTSTTTTTTTSVVPPSSSVVPPISTSVSPSPTTFPVSQ